MKKQHHSNKKKPSRLDRTATSPQRSRHDNTDWPDVVYGRNPVHEVLRAKKRKVFEILIAEPLPVFQESPLWELAKKASVTVNETSAQQLNHLSREGVHQNILARVERYPEYKLSDVFEDPSPKQLVLVLDSIQDPQNFGTLCRSALAFGVKYVIFPKDRSVSLTGTVCKASAGAVEHLKLIQVTNLARTLEEFKEKQYWTYGASLDAGSVALASVRPADKSVLVMGSEGKGLRRLVAETCDQLVKIEMAVDFDSLNVAQAGSVMLYEFMKTILLK